MFNAETLTCNSKVEHALISMFQTLLHCINDCFWPSKCAALGQLLVMSRSCWPAETAVLVLPGVATSQFG
jgi:hypothetical protein